MSTVAQIVGGLAVVGGLGLVAFTVSFRTKFRPVQDAIRRLNRDVVPDAGAADANPHFPRRERRMHRL